MKHISRDAVYKFIIMQTYLYTSSTYCAISAKFQVSFVTIFVDNIRLNVSTKASLEGNMSCGPKNNICR